MELACGYHQTHPGLLLYFSELLGLGIIIVAACGSEEIEISPFRAPPAMKPILCSVENTVTPITCCASRKNK